MFIDVKQVYLHKEPVDFRKSINGLSLIVIEQMKLDLFSETLFLFTNKTKRLIKILYWDKTGFCLWYKRLEKDKFKWPKKIQQKTISLSEEQFCWLLKGIDFTAIKEHKILNYSTIN